MDVPSIFLPSRLNRRTFLKTAGAVAGATTLGSALAACGGSGSGSTVTLQHWDYYVSQSPWLANEIELFQKANPSIKIKRTIQTSTAYDNLFNLAYKSNKLPDTFMVTGTATPYPKQMQDGWWLPVDKWINDAWKNRFPAGTFYQGNNMFNGHTYTAPLGGFGAFQELYLNTDVFKAAGLTNSDGTPKVPQTWDEVTSFADIITKKGNGQYYGLGFGAGGGGQVCNWVDMFIRPAGVPGGAFGATGGTWYDGFDYRVGKYTFASDRNWTDFINLLLEWKNRGYFYPNSMSITDETARVYFEQGKFGMIVGGPWNQPEWTTHGFTNYTMTTLIGPTTARKGFYYHTPGGQEFAISAKTKYPEESWKWFSWIYSDASLQRWVQTYNEDLAAVTSLNDPSKIKFKPFAEYVATQPLNLTYPNPLVRNPDTSKVVLSAISPTLNDTVVGLWTGQLKDMHAALSDVEGRANAAIQKAVSLAQSSGAKVSMNDYIYQDWDITKNYITTPGQPGQ
ncbi:MAG TPA: substrate-binding domain-containing protein [Ktedonobacteraceae bacterium]|jgi:ABC-type glycerol-3-phosphate transport system substrate-binding protein